MYVSCYLLIKRVYFTRTCDLKTAALLWKMLGCNILQHKVLDKKYVKHLFLALYHTREILNLLTVVN